MVNLNLQESEIFDYLIACCTKAGLDFEATLILQTAAKIFWSWLGAVDRGNSSGWWQFSSTGWAQISPAGSDERAFKTSLGQVLSQCALTVPNLARAKWSTTEKKQGDLFEQAIGGGINAAKSKLIVLDSPAIPPGVPMSGRELAMYDQICAGLSGRDIEHITAGMSITVLVKTFSLWLDACHQCETEGRDQSTGSGFLVAAPWADHERRLFNDLTPWFSKCGLTIQAQMLVAQTVKGGAREDGLFAGLVSLATATPPKRLQH